MGATGNLSLEARARYRYLERLICAEVPPPAAIVELGAAPGDQIARLASLGFTATSLDIGVAADTWGGREDGGMERLLKESGVNDIKWNLEEVPYPLQDNAFDAVVMTEVYEHLRDYPVKSLQEVVRILRPGGRLYFTTPNAAYVVNRFRALAGKSIATPLTDWIGGLPHARHAREYTFAEIDELLNCVGLRCIRRESRHFHIQVGRGGISKLIKYVITFISKVRPTFGPEIIVVAEKANALGAFPA